MDSTRTLKARYNRAICDLRCAIGGALIKLGAKITSAAVHSHRGGKDWDWKVSTTRVRSHLAANAQGERRTE